MAGDHVHVLLRFLAKVQQRVIDDVAAVLPLRPLIHAVVAAEAVREGGVHSDDDSHHARIVRILVQCALDPGHLRVVEHVVRGVVHVDEVHSALNPAVVRADRMIVRIIHQPLLLDFRPCQPVAELGDEVAAVALHRFMISDSQNNRRGSEGTDLILLKILPGTACPVCPDPTLAGRVAAILQVFAAHTFVFPHAPAEIAEMPVELRAVLRGVFGYRGHYYVPAIS